MGSVSIPRYWDNWHLFGNNREMMKKGFDIRMKKTILLTFRSHKSNRILTFVREKY